jgi:hypothetical protein
MLLSKLKKHIVNEFKTNLDFFKDKISYIGLIPLLFIEIVILSYKTVRIFLSPRLHIIWFMKFCGN